MSGILERDRQERDPGEEERMLSKQIEQLDRLEILDNERRLREQGSTFMAHTHNDVGGRYAAISSPVVVGSESIPKYPAAFLQHDPVPDEPKLGFDVNAMEPVGQPHELAASLSSLGSSLPLVQAPLGRQEAKATRSVRGAERGDPTDVPPPGAVGSPLFKPKTFRRA